MPNSSWEVAKFHPVRTVSFELPVANGAAGSFDVAVWSWKSKGTLVDFVVHQVTAGTVASGTPTTTVDLKINGTTTLATLAKTAQADGAGSVVDMRKDLALPTNGVRPVKSATASALRISKGQRLQVVTADVGGTYTTRPTFIISAVFDPDPNVTR